MDVDDIIGWLAIIYMIDIDDELVGYISGSIHVAPKVWLWDPTLIEE
jgi:hypothetical protein